MCFRISGVVAALNMLSMNWRRTAGPPLPFMVDDHSFIFASSDSGAFRITEPSTLRSAATFFGASAITCRATLVPMLWLTSTARSIFAASMAASTPREKNFRS